MNYCTKGQWLAILTTGQVGIIDVIINRRMPDKDGVVIVQCGSCGPFVKTQMGMLRELSQKEIDIETGVRHHED